MNIDNKLDLAWAAGFLDGEGNYAYNPYSSRGKRYYRPLIQAAQVDRRPLDKLCTILGGKVYGPYVPRTDRSQPYFQWTLQGFMLVQAAIAAMYSFMAAPKAEQAIAALLSSKIHQSYKIGHAHSWCRICQPHAKLLKENR